MQVDMPEKEIGAIMNEFMAGSILATYVWAWTVDVQQANLFYFPNFNVISMVAIHINERWLYNSVEIYFLGNTA